MALTAAALLAVWPNHVRESHFALTDVPLTFLTMATFLLSLRAYESGRLSWFLGAGAAAGLASASKYNGAYALLLPMIAAAVIHAPAGDRFVRGAVAVMAAVFAFLIAAPYTVLDLPRFLVFPLVCFHAIATKDWIFARYLLPAVPFLCLIMAIGVVDVATRIWQMHRPSAGSRSAHRSNTSHAGRRLSSPRQMRSGLSSRTRRNTQWSTLRIGACSTTQATVCRRRTDSGDHRSADNHLPARFSDSLKGAHASDATQ